MQFKEKSVMDKSLEGKVIIVTGGARDIGRAISLAFGSRGTCVAVNYHQSENLAGETVKEIESIGGKAIAVKADLTVWEHVQELVSETIDAFGQPFRLTFVPRASAGRSPYPTVRVVTGMNCQFPGRNFHPLATCAFVAHQDIVVRNSSISIP
jgi:NAD(P)-dependent dehydrogenase (short-subunit alcohol dehydrogenase family)